MRNVISVHEFSNPTEQRSMQNEQALPVNQFLFERHPVQLAIDLLQLRTVKAYVLKKPEGSVYRFLRSEEHARQFASGKIYISTLEACRAYEEEGRGDAEEGYEQRVIDHARGGSNDPAFVELARKVSIHIGEGCSNVSLRNVKSINSIHDAYVLCTTDQFDPKKLGPRYGEYCVEITNPFAFFNVVTQALLGHTALKEAAMGPIIYKERLIKNMDESPGPIGFVKPPDIYASDREYRFLWTVIQAEIKGILIDVPDASRYLKRLV